MSACAELHYHQHAARLQEALCEARELIVELERQLAETRRTHPTVKAALLATLPLVAAAHIADGEIIDEH